MMFPSEDTALSFTILSEFIDNNVNKEEAAIALMVMANKIKGDFMPCGHHKDALVSGESNYCIVCEKENEI